MSDQRIQATDRMIGANHPTLSDTLNKLALIGHNSDGTHKAGVASIDCSQYTSLNAAISAIGATVTTLTISTTVTTTGGFTIPSTLQLAVLKGGLINHGADVGTITGPFLGGAYQCFSGAGAITFGDESIRMYDPIWFGTSTIQGNPLIFKGAGFAIKDTLNGKTYQITVQNGVLQPVEI